MKIFFCDICNESIPMKLVQEGQVHTVKGKVICSACMPAPPPSASTPIAVSSTVPRAGGGSGAWIAGFALLLAAGAAGMTGWSYLQIRDRLDQLEGQMETSLKKSDLDGLRGDAAEARADITRRLEGFGDRMNSLWFAKPF